MRAYVMSLVAASLLALPLDAATVTSNLDSGPGTLRDVIATAAPGDTITFNLSTPATITLTAGEIMLGKNVTISGPGAALLTISGNNASRIFNVQPSVQVAISGVTLANGRFAPASPGAGQGGCIVSDGALSLSSCVVQGCTALGANEATVPATAGQGGGVAVLSGSLTVADCTFSNNRAIGGDGATNAVAAGNGAGGAIWVAPGATAATLTDATFSGNFAVGGSSTVTGSDCAMAGNGLGAGVEAAGGTIALERSTFAANRALGGNADSEGGAMMAGAAAGGGYFQEAGAATLTNDTFSGNGALGGTQGHLLIPPVAPLPGADAVRDSGLRALTAPLVLCVGSAGPALGGGLAAQGGTAALVHLTVAGNSVAAGSGPDPALFVAGGGYGMFLGGSVTLATSIVSGNTAPTGPDFMRLSGSFASGGYNIISTPPAGVAFAPTTGDDIGNGTDPLLGPLAANGGLTQTRLIAFASPARDAIPVPSCGASEDQRTVPRPQGPGCDVGAVELALVAAQVPTLSLAGLLTLSLLLALAGAAHLIGRRRRRA